MRARFQARGGVTVGSNVRFGRSVRCDVAPGGRIAIGRGVEIAPHTSISAGPGAVVEIGEGVFIGPSCGVAASGRIVIGAASMLAESVTIRDHDHDPAKPPRSGAMLQADVHVGQRVWIAAKVSVGRGVSIGDDSVIGAHAFVSRSVPAECLAVGVPARVVRRRIKA
ncbi:MAG: acyltransferase [Solirubrobacterales bacterium]|nr:acyltransferase [Solirubrobacterales bacterium]